MTDNAFGPGPRRWSPPRRATKAAICAHSLDRAGGECVGGQAELSSVDTMGTRSATGGQGWR